MTCRLATSAPSRWPWLSWPLSAVSPGSKPMLSFGLFMAMLGIACVTSEASEALPTLAPVAGLSSVLAILATMVCMGVN